MMQIDYTSYRSENFNRRPRFLIFHYTAQNFADSIKTLTNRAVSFVSAHYLIPDETDKTYKERGFNVMRIFNLVDENERAWHAGVSSWAGRNNLNDTSIGVEIVNQATDTNGKFHFPDFTNEQIKAITSLGNNIIQRYPDMTPTHILGHSDIALGRKSDPGAAFPWESLHEAGIGAWYDKDQKEYYVTKFCQEGLPSRVELIKKFQRYGYNINSCSSDEEFSHLLRAFQLHFRPEDYCGQLDVETAAILYALIDKYFNA